MTKNNIDNKMPGTYSQLYIHVVFAVKFRQNILLKPWRNEVFKYMAGIIEHKGHKSIIVNGVEDHVHLLIGLKPSAAISDLVRDIKNNTTNFINERKFASGRFAWQEGFGVFSCGHLDLNNVYRYVLNQEEHHLKRTFKEEYIDSLTEFNIDYNEKYLFDWI